VSNAWAESYIEVSSPSCRQLSESMMVQMQKGHTYDPDFFERIVVFQRDDVFSERDELQVVRRQSYVAQDAFLLEYTRHEGGHSWHEKQSVCMSLRVLCAALDLI
jgi:hypothetical protein